MKDRWSVPLALAILAATASLIGSALFTQSGASRRGEPDFPTAEPENVPLPPEPDDELPGPSSASDPDSFEASQRLRKQLNIQGTHDLMARIKQAVEGGIWDHVKKLFSLFHPADTSDLADLRKLLRKSPDPKIRSYAALALGEIQDPSAAPDLIEAMKTDPYGNTRLFASKALGRIGGERAVAALTQAMVDEEDLRVARTAAAMLGSTGSLEAIPALLDRIRNSNDESVRILAVDAITRIQGDPATDSLLQIAKDNGVPLDSRCASIEALGQIGNPRAVGALLALGTGLTEPLEVRTQALSALRNVEPTTQILATLETTYSGSPETVIRTQVLATLGELGGRTSLAALQRAYRNETTSSLRMRAAYAMVRSGGRGVETAIESIASGDPEESVRDFARRLLQEIRDPQEN